MLAVTFWILFMWTGNMSSQTISMMRFPDQPECVSTADALYKAGMERRGFLQNGINRSDFMCVEVDVK